MLSPILHLGADLICAHGGHAVPMSSFERVTVAGQPIVRMTDRFDIVGCALVPASGMGPCLSGQFLSGATRIYAGSLPVLVQDSASMCDPTGTPLTVLTVQLRVNAT